MKVLITGKDGQLGRALLASAPAGWACLALDRAALDLTDDAAIARSVSAAMPDVVINCAAYTQVDKAETESDLALRVNGQAVSALAKAARNCGARLVQISTDFVFDGTSGKPYPPDAPTNPLSVYGKSKLAGEQAAGALPDALIVRTAWVYAAQGGNFVNTMLRLMAERDALGVVADQIGTPTHAASLARAIWHLITAKAHGTYHFTDSGVASWYDFAVAIHEEALALDLLDRSVAIRPIASADYPQAAVRPGFSVLDKTATWQALGGPTLHWRAELRLMLQHLRDLRR